MSKTKAQIAARAWIDNALAERGIPPVGSRGPIIAKIYVLDAEAAAELARTPAEREARARDFAETQARWSKWDAVLTDVLEPGDMPVLEPLMEND